MCHLGDCSVFANKIISKVFSARRPHFFSGVAVVLTTNKTFNRNVYHCKTFEAIFYLLSAQSSHMISNLFEFIQKLT